MLSLKAGDIYEMRFVDLNFAAIFQYSQGE